MADDELAALEQGSRGLLYPSETDAPFEPFRWSTEGEDLRSVLARNIGGAISNVEEVSIDQFFDELIQNGEDAARFGELRRVVVERLRDPKVLRVGSTKIDVFIVGKARSGDWVGLHTTSVETG